MGEEVGRRAVMAELEILKAKGDVEGAHALFLEAAPVYGMDDDLKRAAGETATFAGPAGEPVDRPTRRPSRGSSRRASRSSRPASTPSGRRRRPCRSGRAKATVGATGAVTEPSLVSTTLANPTAEACLVKAIGAMKFPAPPVGAVVVMTWPIEFAPAAVVAKP